MLLIKSFISILTCNPPLLEKRRNKADFRRNISFASQYNEHRGKVKWNTDLNLKKYTLSTIYKVYIENRQSGTLLCEQTGYTVLIEIYISFIISHPLWLYDYIGKLKYKLFVP